MRRGLKERPMCVGNIDITREQNTHVFSVWEYYKIKKEVKRRIKLILLTVAILT
jgi:hypothetical protein